MTQYADATYHAPKGVVYEVLLVTLAIHSALTFFFLSLILMSSSMPKVGLLRHGCVEGK